MRGPARSDELRDLGRVRLRGDSAGLCIVGLGIMRGTVLRSGLGVGTIVHSIPCDLGLPFVGQALRISGIDSFFGDPRAELHDFLGPLG